MNENNTIEVEVERRSDKYNVLVHLLDGTNVAAPFNDNTTGFQLLRHVCRVVKVKEHAYFGLYWKDVHNEICWIDMEKHVRKKLKGKLLQSGICFGVKFYHSDPAQIEDVQTRHQLVLQIRNSVSSGDLSCSFVTHALLGSFVVQSLIGDYDPSKMTGNYVRKFVFAPNQTTELEKRIMELHQTHSGMTKEEAEIDFLENARKLPFYGVELHAAEDLDSVHLTIGVCWSGILVFREQTRINRFAWPRIVKISYTRNKFLVRIRPLDGDIHDSVVSFKLDTIKNAKSLWKTCMQHHQFFRVN